LNELLADKAADHNQIDALEWKMSILETVLHAADISNPCKPNKIMLNWTKRFSEESWAQGDEERSLHLPISPMCDRSGGISSVPKCQIGFINFVIMPFYQPIGELMPEALEALQNLAENKAFWEEKDREKASFEELFEFAE